MTESQCERVWEARRMREGGIAWWKLTWEERVAWVHQCRLVKDVLDVLEEDLRAETEGLRSEVKP